MELFTPVVASLFALWILCHQGVYAGPMNSVGVDCTLDDDHTNPTLDRCLERGQQFAEKYEKYLKKGKQMDVCVEYKDFGSCLRPMLQTCPSINTTIDKKWKTILHQLDCICSNLEGDCPVDLGCLATEHGSIYTGLCQNLYEFNIRQRTHGKCRFLRERIDCEQSLVASSCGEPTGDFYLSMLKARSKKEKCFVPHSYPNIQHFSYSDRCPKNLTLMFSECVDLHPTRTILNFMPENDLIAEGKKKAVKVSCKHFEKYNQCVKKLATQCHLGIEKLLQSNGQLRSYQLKMEYICSDVRQDYLDNMYCYQEVLRNKSFEKCTGAWDDVFVKLENVTSYQFYCLPQHHSTLALSRELETLRTCYRKVVEDSCGHTGALTIGNLIKLAFQDPHYLRLDYKADCTLHNTDTPPPSTHPPDTPSPATTRLSSTSSQSRRSHRQHTVTDSRSYHKNRPTPVARASSTGGSRSIHILAWTNLLMWMVGVICIGRIRERVL